MKKIGTIALIILLTGCIQGEQTTPTSETNAGVGELFKAYAEANQKTIEETRAFFEKTYGIRDEKKIWEKLPPKPATFDADKQKLYEGTSEKLAEIPYESYIQPEFYPTFEEIGKKAWINAPTTWTDTAGIFVTPADQKGIIYPDTNEFETILFVSSGWGTTHYQAIELYAQIEPNVPINIEIEPQTLLLGPAFPLFDTEWSKKVTIRGNMTQKIPEGTYRITIKSQSARERGELTIPNNAKVVGQGFFIPENGLATLTLTTKYDP